MSQSIRVGTMFYELKLDRAGFSTAMNQTLNDARRFSTQMKSTLNGVETSSRQAFNTSTQHSSKWAKDTNTHMGQVTQSANKAATGMSGSFRGAFASIGAGLAGLGIGVGLAGVATVMKQTVEAASNQEQAFGALDTVLGDLSPKVKDWSKEQYKIGLSTTDASKAVTDLTSMLTNNGVALDESVEKSQTLTLLAADMAAAFGGTTVDAVDAISAALRGETDPIERYGVSMKQASIDAYALENGLAASKQEITATVKAQAAYGLMLQQTSKIQGQAVRETGTYEGQLNALRSQWTNTKADAGKAFMPVAVEWMTKLNNVMPEVAANVQKWAPVVDKWLTGVSDGVKANWPEIKEAIMQVGDSLKMIGGIAKSMFDAFLALPPEMQKFIATVAVLQKSGVITFAFSGVQAMSSVLQSYAALSGGGGAGAGGSAGVVSGGAATAAIAAAAVAAVGYAGFQSVQGADGTVSRARSLNPNASAAEVGAAGYADFADKLTSLPGFKQLASATGYRGLIDSRNAEYARLDQARAKSQELGVTIDVDDTEFQSWWEQWKGGVSAGWGEITGAFSNNIASLTGQLAAGWNGITGAIGNVISGAVSGFVGLWAGAYNGALGFVSNVNNAITGMAYNAYTTITGWFGSAFNTVRGWISGLWTGITGSVGNVFGGIKTALGFAQGGYVTGPGTGTSDSILANVSNGEFVVRAERVKQLGVATMHRINGTPGYAQGGLVGTTPGYSGGAGVGGMSVGNITIVTQDLSGFERELRARQRSHALAGRR